MGLLDFLMKSAELLSQLNIGRESDVSESVESTNTEELIAECEHYLSVVVKLTVNDDRDIIDTLTAFDRRYLKLDRIEASTDEFALSKKLNDLEHRREKALTDIENMYYDLLNKLQEESKAEKDPVRWSELNDEWFDYNKRLSKISNYQLKYLERLCNQASDYLDM
ncbi:MAG: hypothetical protein IKJ83_02230 [Ruminococcus sp.]|nr:hypothetical protein [Ruminococcus sp.]